MTIVRYTNKETGIVSLYESTSHYDPVTKQSRPVRKYLGREDPVTGELIPSSKKRGRKKEHVYPPAENANPSNNTQIAGLKERYEKKISSLEELVNEQKSAIKKLEAEKASMIKKLTALLTEFSE